MKKKYKRTKGNYVRIKTKKMDWLLKLPKIFNKTLTFNFPAVISPC